MSCPCDRLVWIETESGSTVFVFLRADVWVCPLFMVPPKWLRLSFLPQRKLPSTSTPQLALIGCNLWTFMAQPLAHLPRFASVARVASRPFLSGAAWQLSQQQRAAQRGYGPGLRARHRQRRLPAPAGARRFAGSVWAGRG